MRHGCAGMKLTLNRSSLSLPDYPALGQQAYEGQFSSDDELMEDDLARTTQFPQRAYGGQNRSDSDLMEDNLDNTTVLKFLQKN
ncbi:hypothetical protein CEXT_542401 [Caerostris extrusa]|uniref:Uncharacterized protein n=1 Tax=Caerostris extrusa TaxID=172846 RepID=A0AAV4NNK8_CAEEX|nr:hypothetical protein CEXT_542401 [Caerostris extrusa]